MSMGLKEIRWIAPGTDNFPEATCIGTTVAVSSLKEMKCTRPATVWRVLVLLDGTEVPKPYCEEHRGPEAARWEQIMQEWKDKLAKVANPKADPKKVEPKAETIKAKAKTAKGSRKAVAAKLVETASAVAPDKRTRRSSFRDSIGKVRVCFTCYKTMAVGELCPDHER